MIKSALLYGSEIWRLTENIKKIIETEEMDAIRRAARISRMERIRNEEMKEIMGIESSIIQDVERKQLIWYGHVERMEEKRLSKKAMKWIPPGRKKRGRPKRNWMKGIRKAMSVRDLRNGEWDNRGKCKLGIGQRRRTFLTDYIYITCIYYLYLYLYIFFID